MSSTQVRSTVQIRVRPHRVHSKLRFSTYAEIGCGSISMIRISPVQTKQCPHNASVGCGVSANMPVRRASARVLARDANGGSSKRLRPGRHQGGDAITDHPTLFQENCLSNSIPQCGGVRGAAQHLSARDLSATLAALHNSPERRYLRATRPPSENVSGGAAKTRRPTRRARQVPRSPRRSASACAASSRSANRKRKPPDRASRRRSQTAAHPWRPPWRATCRTGTGPHRSSNNRATGLRRIYLKPHHMQAGVGHYGAFSGNRWTSQIYSDCQKQDFGQCLN
jgi:hypothetical protein